MNALKDIRVIDFSWLMPGPYASMQLADLGAEVVKVEQPGRGDYARENLPDHFRMANRNKRSVAIDLKQPEGREVALRLVERADVLLEGFRPGVMARLGLGPDDLTRRFPRLVYCSISGFGQTGPYRDWPAHDIGCMGVGGGFSMPGDLRYPAVKGPLPVGDFTAGMFAAQSILAALFERQQSGRGQVLDVALTDCVAAWAGVPLGSVLWNGEPPPARFNAASHIFETADGKRISLAASEDHFWDALCRVLGRADWLADARLRTIGGRREHAAELMPQLEQAIRQRSAAEWLELFTAHDVPAAPVHGPMETFEDPQIVHRRMAWTAPPDGSGKPRRVVAYPVKFSRTPPELRNTAPALGGDTDAVLGEAGLDPQAIAGLRARRIVA